MTEIAGEWLGWEGGIVLQRCLMTSSPWLGFESLVPRSEFSPAEA